MTNNQTRSYLGDSVYVEIENGCLKLTTDNGIGASNVIILEYEVYEALVAYVKRITTMKDV